MTSTDNEALARIQPVLPSAQGDQAYQRLWYALARRPWKTLILVPSHPDISADEAARMLAEVGEKVSGLPVKAITMSALDYGTALALSDLQEQIRRLTIELAQPQQAIEVTPTKSETMGPGWVMADGEGSGGEPGRGAEPGEERGDGEPAPGPGLRPRSVAKFVIAIPCLIHEPLGLSATQAADAVIILMELGRTRMEDVRRIVEQVGRERVVGCILVK